MHSDSKRLFCRTSIKFKHDFSFPAVSDLDNERSIPIYLQYRSPNALEEDLFTVDSRTPCLIHLHQKARQVCVEVTKNVSYVSYSLPCFALFRYSVSKVPKRIYSITCVESILREFEWLIWYFQLVILNNLCWNHVLGYSSIIPGRKYIIVSPRNQTLEEPISYTLILQWSCLLLNCFALWFQERFTSVEWGIAVLLKKNFANLSITLSKTGFITNSIFAKGSELYPKRVRRLCETESSEVTRSETAHGWILFTNFRWMPRAFVEKFDVLLICESLFYIFNI